MAVELDPAVVAKAREHLRWAELMVEPRLQWPSGMEDLADSRWTLTVVGAALLEAGSGPASPFVLAKAERLSRKWPPS